MGKLQPKVIPGMLDPFVRWSLYRFTLMKWSGCDLNLSPSPPDNPGEHSGYWHIDRIDRIDERTVAVKWVFTPEIHDRHARLTQAVGELIGSLRSVFKEGEVHVMVGGHAFEVPDTSEDRCLWESVIKWAWALRGGKQR